MKRHHVVLILLYFILLGCQNETTESEVLDKENLEVELQKRLIEARQGEKIVLPEGTFNFKRELSLTDISDITLIGAGKGKTILSFKEQLEGAQGILVKDVSNVRLEGFSVLDSKGDAIKVQDCMNVIMRDLEASWTGGRLSSNGAYGLYPVSSKNILLEKCEASYAMDAGIYVGQSQNVIVRDNYVHNNVAGLEIENTITGEVYNNTARNNTGGMLIFDMPDLPQANGDRIKFYDNIIEGNNGENFAPKGMVVSTIPPGSGVVIMAHSNIEMYNNTIKDHKTFGVAVNSWLFTGLPYEPQEYDPFCSNINIHDNVISGIQGPTDSSTDYGKLLTMLLGGEPADMITDGIFNPAFTDELGRPEGFCFKNNGELRFVNLNGGESADPEVMARNMNTDITIFNCNLPGFDTSDHDRWLEQLNKR